MPHPDRPWHGVGLTHVGLVRTSNQDAFTTSDRAGVWIVADGMGGHAGGEVASRLAVETIASDKRLAEPSRDSRPQDDMETVLKDVIRAANDAIRREAVRQPALAGMGTTVVVVHIAPGSTALAQATIAHVGDSRAYLLRDGTLTRLTRDHSWVDDRVRDGVLTPQDAAHHPLRHVLSRALGPNEDVEPDLSTHMLAPDDRLLLCTDGLTKMLEDDQIAALIFQADSNPETVCRRLIEKANQEGGKDNTTVILVARSTMTA